MKRCTGCGVQKPLTEFGKRSASKDGLNYRCKSCKTTETMAWARANPEKRRATHRRYQHRNNDARLAQNKKWRQERAAEQSMRTRAWQHANPERFAENRRRWKEKNRERVREIKRARKRHATPSWADMEKIRAIYRERARLTAQTGIEHHVDHVIPLHHRLVCGLHVHQNLEVLPAEVNMRKSNRFVVA